MKFKSPKCESLFAAIINIYKNFNEFLLSGPLREPLFISSILIIKVYHLLTG